MQDESIKVLLRDYKTIPANAECTEEDLSNHCIKHIGYVIKQKVLGKTQNAKEISLDDLWVILDSLS